MKSGNLNFLQTSEPLQACNEIALPLVYVWFSYVLYSWINSSENYPRSSFKNTARIQQWFLFSETLHWISFAGTNKISNSVRTSDSIRGVYRRASTVDEEARFMKLGPRLWVCGTFYSASSLWRNFLLLLHLKVHDTPAHGQWWGGNPEKYFSQGNGLRDSNPGLPGEISRRVISMLWSLYTVIGLP